MVAEINTGYSIRRILNYNENKVSENLAACIGAFGYPKDLLDLSYSNKLNLLQNQAALRTSLRRHAIHISLNFSPQEKDRFKDNDELLRRLAEDYMERIGFGNQPFLVYRHDDAGHPHMHIVSLKIDNKGGAVNTQNIGRNQSKRACTEMELKYNLIRAAEQGKDKMQYTINRLPLQKVLYGQIDTRRAIGNVLDQVLEKYRYTSLAELNAVLGVYNVIADPGSEDSRVFQHKGLHYQACNDKGERAGKKIKASSFHNSPGISFLQAQFKKNKGTRKKETTRLKNTIDLLLLRRSTTSIFKLQKELQLQGIDLVLRKSKDGRIFGLTYVDHRTCCVFNGSELDKVSKAYSAAAILKRCEANQIAASPKNSHFTPTHEVTPHSDKIPHEVGHDISEMFEILMQTEYVPDTLPFHLRRRKKKKKNKNRDQSI